MKYIPKDVFDKRAVEKNQVVFHEIAFIDVKPHIDGNKLAIELTDFSVSYEQGVIDNIAAELGNNRNKVAVEQGQIIRITKDEKGTITKDVLTKKWSDWIDYWSVDFDYESKKEMIRVQNPADKSYEEKWTGDYIFENEWQSFRTKKDRKLEFTTAKHEHTHTKGRRKVAIKVVDIFGNDTMKIIEVTI